MDFVSSKEIWSDVEAWANEEGYKLKTQHEIERIYRKGGNAYLLLRQDVDKVHIEAWLIFDMLFFKREVAVDATDLSNPLRIRNRHVMQVNKLLVMLGGPFLINDPLDSVCV